MAQILDPLPPDQSGKLLCCYVNATSKIQIARISNIPNWYFERVVFPGQRLVFEAPPQSVLEIHTGMMASAILSDNIACDRLCINEDTSFSGEMNQEEGEAAKDKESPQRKEKLTTAVLTSVD
jgi:hypothetical protein